MKRVLFSFVALLCAITSNAQIGYQVSLLNTATGEPRAFETVKCEIEIKDSEKKTVHKETQTATSNDFGVISLSIGDEHTFDEMDWSKLPLFVSVSIGGKLVGESQILTVPVAEYAKKTGALTYENIHEKNVVGFNWGSVIVYEWRFSGNTVELVRTYEKNVGTRHGILRIDGNTVFGYTVAQGWENGPVTIPFIGHYSPEDETIYVVEHPYRF